MATVPVVWKSGAEALANNKPPATSWTANDNPFVARSLSAAADPVHPLAH